MTLYEATRELKEGQAIEWDFQGRTLRIAEWRHGEEPNIPAFGPLELTFTVRIIDLPKPQPTLYDVLVEGAGRIGVKIDCDNCKYTSDCTGVSCFTALIDTLCDIALAAGFDLKQITGAGEE